MPPRFRLTAGSKVRFSDDGSLLVCIGSNVVLNDIVKRERLWVSHPFKHPSNLDFSPNGKMLAVKNTSGRIAVLDTRSGEVLHDDKQQKDEGCQPHFSSNGKEIVDASWKDGVTIRSVIEGTIRSREIFPGEMIQRVSHDIHRQVWLLQHHPRSASSDRSLYKGYISIHEWPFHPKTGRILRFPWNMTESTLSPDGKHFCFSDISPTSNLRIARVSDGEIVARSAPSAIARGNEMTWSFDGGLIGAIEKHRFTFYRASDLSVVAEVPAAYPASIAFRPGTQEIALGTWGASTIVQISAVLQNQVKMK